MNDELGVLGGPRRRRERDRKPSPPPMQKRMEEATKPPTLQQSSPPHDAAPGHASEIILQVETTKVRFTFELIEENQGDIGAWLWWSDLLARAEREIVQLEAHAMRLKAQALANIVQRDHKIAEWKARVLIDETAQLLDLRMAMSEARRNVILLREVVAALRPANRQPPSHT